jgi:hypothetical protein
VSGKTPNGADFLLGVGEIQTTPAAAAVLALRYTENGFSVGDTLTISHDGEAFAPATFQLVADGEGDAELLIDRDNLDVLDELASRIPVLIPQLTAVRDGLNLTLTASTVGPGGNAIHISASFTGDSWFAGLPTNLAGGAAAEDRHVIPGAAGGTLRCGYIAVLQNGEGVNATDVDEDGVGGSNQVVQLPNIPCRQLVIALPKGTNLNTAFLPEGRASKNSGGMLFFGDASSQRFYLEEGDAEILDVGNANQIFLRDPSFAWEDFNSEGHLLDYTLTAYWRVIK